MNWRYMAMRTYVSWTLLMIVGAQRSGNASITTTTESCKTMVYHVQTLHQANQCCHNETHPANAGALEDIKSQFAALQAKMQVLENQDKLQTAKIQALESHVSSQDKKWSCPPGYTAPYNSACYKFVRIETNWFDGMLTCRAEGATLVTIETASENAHIVNYIKSKSDLVNVGGWGYWIGATELAKYGVWKWASDGKNLVYKSWAPGEPSSTTEHCVHMKKVAGWRWNDYVCSQNSRYICEKPMVFQ